MSREFFTLQERAALADGMRSGTLARQYQRAFKAGRDFWSLLHNNQLAFAILAEQLEESAVDDLGGAFERLADQVEAMHRTITRIMADTDRSCSEERRRLRDHIDYGIARRVEIGQERARLEHTIAIGGDQKAKEKRLKMSNAGVTGADLDRLAPPFDSEAVRAQIAELDREDALISEFCRTYNPDVLPPDYGERAASYRALMEQRRTVEGPRLSVMGP